MNITFIGAAHEVTGSCTYVEAGKTRFIVDCGMEQGRDTFVNSSLPVFQGDVDFVLLTHAHIDHSGNLPLFGKQGFRGPVYATEATCNLCNIMLRDSAHIQMSEAEYKSRKARRSGGADIAPVYDIEDAERIIKKLRPCGYGEMIQVSEEVTVRFTDIGHLLGSACVEVWLTEDGETRKIVFSGDVGNTNQPILKDPSRVAEADYVLIESTYGDKMHPGRPAHVEPLAEMIERTLSRGGNVIIPSFAVGRTQEMLYFIREIKERGLVKGHDGFKVYIDSPLAVEATGIFMQCDTDYIDAEMRELIERGINPLSFDGLEISQSVEESKAINADPEPKVIISASGMCDAGRVRHHLKHNLWRPESLVLFVGYQAEGTLGRILFDGAKSVKLFGEEIAVHAEISWLPGVSGHADQAGLLHWLDGFEKKPTRVFVNHGDVEACTEFTRLLNEERGFNAYAPYSGTVFDLRRDAFVRELYGIPVEEKASRRQENEVFRRLREAAERLLVTVRGVEGRSNRELRDYIKKIESLTKQME